MPRLSIQQCDFTTGEISPRLAGRVDIDRYQHAAKGLVNAHPVIHGGAFRRAGTRYVFPTALGATQPARLIEFIVSQDEAYMLEFGQFYVRIYKPDGVATGIQLASPYSVTQVGELDYTQGADTMFLFHGDVPPQRLRNFSPTSWDLSPAPFTTTPFDEIGYRPAATLTLSATTGVAVTATASGGVFLPSDVGRDLISSAGAGLIVGYSSPAVVTVKVTTAFSGVSLAPGAWYLDLSPQTFLKPSAKGPVGATVSLFASATRAATLTLSGTTGAITINASAGVFAPGDTGAVLYADSGQVTLTYVSATQCSGTTTSDFANTTYPTAAWGITAGAFRSPGDVGKYIRLNNGLLRITGVNPTTATATIISALDSDVTAPPLAWSLEDSMWSAATGYPSTGTLFEQRLWCANTRKYPQTIFGSRTGLYLDFTKGTKDSDACIFQIASDTVNPISYLASSSTLLVHTYGGEFNMQGGNNSAITPTNVQIKAQSTHGSKGVRPLTVGKESIFVQRSGRKVRAMSYQLAIDGYTAPDLSALAEHITQSGVVDMAYQQEPDGIIWLVLADGTMVSCTLDRDQNVNGWARHYTQGAFESVSVIPNGDFDQVWVIVRRIINGATVRYIEFLDSAFQPFYPAALDPNALPPLAAPVVYGCTVDSGHVYDSAIPSAALVGLEPLEGCTVDVVSDGSFMGSFTVAAGQVTLPRPARRSLVGLHFSSEVSMLTPEVGTGTGTAQGNSMRTGEVTLRFQNTVGAQLVDGEGREQEVPWRQFGSAVLDQAPPLYTGLVRIEMLGWERGRSEITVVQDAPMPMRLLSAIRKFSVND